MTEEEILAIVAERKAIYQAKLDEANEGKRWEPQYDRAELMQHAVEAFEHLEAEIQARTMSHK